MNELNDYPLDKFTVAELKTIAQICNLAGVSKLKKAEVIKVLKQRFKLKREFLSQEMLDLIIKSPLGEKISRLKSEISKSLNLEKPQSFDECVNQSFKRVVENAQDFNIISKGKTKVQLCSEIRERTSPTKSSQEELLEEEEEEQESEDELLEEGEEIQKEQESEDELLEGQESEDELLEEQESEKDLPEESLSQVDYNVITIYKIPTNGKNLVLDINRHTRKNVEKISLDHKDVKSKPILIDSIVIPLSLTFRRVMDTFQDYGAIFDTDDLLTSRPNKFNVYSKKRAVSFPDAIIQIEKAISELQPPFLPLNYRIIYHLYRFIVVGIDFDARFSSVYTDDYVIFDPILQKPIRGGWICENEQEQNVLNFLSMLEQSFHDVLTSDYDKTDQTLREEIIEIVETLDQSTKSGADRRSSSRLGTSIAKKIQFDLLEEIEKKCVYCKSLAPEQKCDFCSLYKKKLTQEQSLAVRSVIVWLTMGHTLNFVDPSQIYTHTDPFIISQIYFALNLSTPTNVKMVEQIKFLLSKAIDDPKFFLIEKRGEFNWILKKIFESNLLLAKREKFLEFLTERDAFLKSEPVAQSSSSTPEYIFPASEPPSSSTPEHIPPSSEKPRQSLQKGSKTVDLPTTLKFLEKYKLSKPVINSINSQVNDNLNDERIGKKMAELVKLKQVEHIDTDVLYSFVQREDRLNILYDIIKDMIVETTIQKELGEKMMIDLENIEIYGHGLHYERKVVKKTGHQPAFLPTETPIFKISSAPPRPEISQRVSEKSSILETPQRVSEKSSILETPQRVSEKSSIFETPQRVSEKPSILETPQRVSPTKLVPKVYTVDPEPQPSFRPVFLPESVQQKMVAKTAVPILKRSVAKQFEFKETQQQPINIPLSESEILDIEHAIKEIREPLSKLSNIETIQYKIFQTLGLIN